MEKLLDSSLGPIASVVFITGAGGMFGGVLRETGIGTALADSLDSLGLPLIVSAYLIALALRVAQGSATVAITTTAGLLGPALATSSLSPAQAALVVVAMGAGSFFASHVNDSGFWMFKEYFNTSIRQTFAIWTVMETLIGLLGLAGVLILNQMI